MSKRHAHPAASGPIVDAEQLRVELDGAPAPQEDDADGTALRVLHVGWAEPAAQAFRAGHVPGAVHLDTDWLEDGYPTWRLLPLAELQRVIGTLGIGPRTRVVVYGEQAIAAARAWWVLRHAGVAEVRFLDGGLRAWRAAGGVVEIGHAEIAPRVFAAPARREMLVTTDQLRAALGRRAVQLGDVRSEAEYAGRSSGYDYVVHAGRLPGAISLGDADDAAGVYLRRDGRLRDPRQIGQLWLDAGMDPRRELILYCGSGWRSSLAQLYAQALGFRRVRNYSDGWAGWSACYRYDAEDRAARGNSA